MKRKIFLAFLTLTVLFLSACQAGPMQISNLNVEIVHETQDRFLEDIPRSATNPSARTQQVQHGMNLYLSIMENSPFDVESWTVYDAFGNQITIKDSPTNFTIYTNHKLVANIVCRSNDACIQGYSCVNNKCVFS